MGTFDVLDNLIWNGLHTTHRFFICLNRSNWYKQHVNVRKKSCKIDSNYKVIFPILISLFCPVVEYRMMMFVPFRAKAWNENPLISTAGKIITIYEQTVNGEHFESNCSHCSGSFKFVSWLELDWSSLLCKT